MHVKIEEFYTDSLEKIDRIAERILTLGRIPLHTFQDFVQNGSIPVGKDVTNDEHAVKLVMTSLKELLILERALLHASDDANDDRTNAITSDFISEQEKTVWMLNSCLN